MRGSAAPFKLSSTPSDLNTPIILITLAAEMEYFCYVFLEELKIPHSHSN
jgi:hypothetical protein